MPLPVPDSGGWRVDTDSPTERCRYVFAAPAPGLAELGRTVTDGGILLKMCGDTDLMRSLLPDRWRVEGGGHMMACDQGMVRPRALPPGYRIELAASGSVTAARIDTEAGELAASGYAAESDGVFIFDRIRTEDGHRRRGLGTALIHALADRRAFPSSRFVLVATDAGRDLYERLGWSVLSPYATARLG